MKHEISIVELIDEADDLVGYGVCVSTINEDKRRSFEMRPEVYGTRTQAHTAALDVRDELAADRPGAAAL